MRLTIPQLKKHPGLEQLTDQQAEQIIEALYQLSVAFYELYSQTKSNKNERRKDKESFALQGEKKS